MPFKEKKPITPLIELLRQKRIEQGLTQYQLAEKLGYDNGMVSSWETGRYRPHRQTLIDWCNGLGVDPPS